MATASVRIDQELFEKATIMAKALNRTAPKQIEHWAKIGEMMEDNPCLLYTSPSPRDRSLSRMPSSA